MKIRIVFILSFFLLFILGCTSMKTTDVINSVLPSGGYNKKTLKYGEHIRQATDVYIPKTEQLKTPVVFIFGGAWRDGTKEDFEFVAHALTGLGHPVIIPNFRLFPEVRFPDFVNDVADAIASIEKQSVEIFNKPLNAFYLMGHSSGAHKAALLATDTRYFNDRGVTAKVGGLIAIAGPYDLDLENHEVSPVFANVSKKQTNPLLNIQKGMSPVLLLHGKKDQRVFPFHTERFAKALNEASVSVKTHIYPKVDHVKILGSIAAPLRFLNNSYTDIKTFLTELER